MASSTFQTVKWLHKLTVISDSATRQGIGILSRIGSILNPATSLVPVLDQWLGEGRAIHRHEFRDAVRFLRTQKRLKHALEFCEWMSGARLFAFAPTDCALHLDLVGAFRGVDAAEAYFNSLGDECQTRETFGAMLSCFVKHRLVEKSLTCFHTAKQLGLANANCYNAMMSLYVRAGHPAKVPSVAAMMKKEGVYPDEFSYRVWVNSCVSESDRVCVERIVEEIETRRPRLDIDWRVYGSVANFFIGIGDVDRALFYLGKSERLLGDEDRAGFSVLVSQYGRLGLKDEMKKLWVVRGERFGKRSNADYVTMLGSLAKVGDVEGTVELVKEWESNCTYYDFHVPEILLGLYCRTGLPEKAEARLGEMVAKVPERGKSSLASNWVNVGGAYLDKQNMDKALECVVKGLSLGSRESNRRIGVGVPAAVLHWLGYNRDVDEVEAYVVLMKSVFPASREMYHSLITAYVRMGRDVGEVLDRMSSDSIDVNQETHRLLNLYSSDSDFN